MRNVFGSPTAKAVGHPTHCLRGRIAIQFLAACSRSEAGGAAGGMPPAIGLGGTAMRVEPGLLLVVAMSAAAWAQNATIEIKAVKLNPTCAGGARDGLPCGLPRDCPGAGVCGGDIQPTNSLSVASNDRIVAEIYASNWASEDLLRAYQLGIPSTFASGPCGDVSVVRGGRFCADDSACADVIGGACVEGLCTPADPRAGGAVIDTSRSDYAFFGLDAFAVIDFGDPNRLFFASALFSSSDSIRYLGSPVYLATIALEVGAQTSAQVNIALAPPPDTLLGNGSNQFITPLELSALTLIADGGECCGIIVDGDPTDCSIDARQLSEPDGAGAVIVESVRVKFDCPDATSVAVPEDWSAREVRPGTPISVDSVAVDPVDQSWVTVHFSRALTDKRWTCVSYNVTGTEACFGILPGDVNQDSLSRQETDLPAMVDCMTQPGNCTLRECDTDRSGACTPADLLRIADILGGGGVFTPPGDQTGILDMNNLPISCP